MPTIFDMLTFLGSFGLFFTLFILFMKFLPAIAIAEIKGVMPEADPHWEGYHKHHADSEANHG
jgi:molybdopterin-containing oxidoreductase family membrane subunit